MESGTFRLKGSSLLQRAKKNGVDNMHQLSLESHISYATILRYFDDSEIKQLDMRVFLTMLIDGIGYSPKELMDAKFSDIFDYVEPENGAAG